jgi:hypothetical protein
MRAVPQTKQTYARIGPSPPPPHFNLSFMGKSLSTYVAGFGTSHDDICGWEPASKVGIQRMQTKKEGERGLLVRSTSDDR